jgi:hypothetical protein
MGDQRLEASAGPIVEWAEVGGRPCLRFVFQGHLTLVGAQRGLQAWRAQLAERPHESTSLVWDCTAMAGYDTAARKAWQVGLGELRARTGVIWVVTDDPVIRMGAKVMNLFLGLDVRSVSSEAEIAG